MVDALISHYNYWLIIILMMLGLYVVVSRGNLVKKIVQRRKIKNPHWTILTVNSGATISTIEKLKIWDRFQRNTRSRKSCRFNTHL